MPWCKLKHWESISPECQGKGLPHSLCLNHESMIVKEGTRPLFVQGIFFHSISHIRAWKFQQNKQKILLLIVLLKERFTSKTVIWLTNENLELKIHLSSLLIPFLGLLAIYHDLIYVHLFLLRKLERETKTEISRSRVGGSVSLVLWVVLKSG